MKIASCQKDDNKDEPSDNSKIEDNGLTKDINDLVNEDALNSIKDLGMPINTGDSPPNLENAYLAKPFVLKATSVPGDDAIGFEFPEFKFRTYDQDNDNLRIKFDYVNGPESGNGYGGFIVGKNNSFTLFLEVVSTNYGSQAQTVFVLSGQISDDGGISNLYFSNFMLDNYGNPAGTWIPNNTGRIIYDSDGFSESTTWYSMKNAPKSNMPSINMVR